MAVPLVGKKEPQTLFQFTRHATSCFNIEIYRDRGITGDGGIPSLAADGIKKTIELAEKNQRNNRFQSPIVCVSNLVRTWMTAILLYAFSNKTTITLRICPYLKEIGWKGNQAYPLTLSVSTFIDFLKLIKTQKGYEQLREIMLLIPAQIERPHTEWVKIKLTIPQGNSVDTKIITDPLFCSRASTVDKISGYNNNGDISEFMKWFSESFPAEKGKVHIVAHSGIMKDYVNKLLKSKTFDIEKYIKGDTAINKQNCWSFTTPLLVKNKDSVKASIQTGYANPGKGELAVAQGLEGPESLCRKSVEEIKCPAKGSIPNLKKGGYQTKKNRRILRRTSHRRK
jgi:hypothetical protein